MTCCCVNKFIIAKEIRRDTLKLAILDKDGTIVAPRSGQTFVQSPEDQMLLSGVAERIAAMKADGWTFVIASNQGGVAAGHKTLESAISEMRYCLELLPGFIREAMFCPDFNGSDLLIVQDETDGFIDFRQHPPTEAIAHFDELNYRKPQPGMLRLAMWRFGVESNPQTCLMIGDRPEDQQAAEAAGVRFLDAEEWRRG